MRTAQMPVSSGPPHQPRRTHPAGGTLSESRNGCRAAQHCDGSQPRHAQGRDGTGLPTPFPEGLLLMSAPSKTRFLGPRLISHHRPEPRSAPWLGGRAWGACARGDGPSIRHITGEGASANDSSSVGRAQEFHSPKPQIRNLQPLCS